MKKYKNGMYGGKFMPFHKGHLSCLELAVKECETVNLILFCGGKQEKDILSKDKREFLTVDNRIERIKEAIKDMENVRFHVINVASCFSDDGEELWDMETPMVLEKTGELDAVYGSEQSYTDYFSRAYPKADYRLVDISRVKVPVSATMIRAMSEEEASKWIV